MSASKESRSVATNPAASQPWFPPLRSLTAATTDPGTVRLGSGCITGEFPAVQGVDKALDGERWALFHKSSSFRKLGA